MCLPSVIILYQQFPANSPYHHHHHRHQLNIDRPQVNSAVAEKPKMCDQRSPFHPSHLVTLASVSRGWPSRPTVPGIRDKHARSLVGGCAWTESVKRAVAWEAEKVRSDTLLCVITKECKQTPISLPSWGQGKRFIQGFATFPHENIHLPAQPGLGDT